MAVSVADKIKQHNDADFFLIDAADVEMKDGGSLEDALKNLPTSGGTTEGHTHDNKDMLDKIIYIDAHPNWGRPNISIDDVDFSAFDNIISGNIYCINVKNESVWLNILANAIQFNDFRPMVSTIDSNTDSAEIDLLSIGSDYCIFMIPYTVAEGNYNSTFETSKTITEAKQYFIAPDGSTYSRTIKKTTTDETVTYDYSGFISLKKENISNKVTSLTPSSTNDQYPSAKAVYDALATKADKTEVTNAIKDLGVIYRYRGTAGADSDIKSGTEIGSFDPGDVYNIGSDFGNEVQVILQSKLGGVSLSETGSVFIDTNEAVRAYFLEHFGSDKTFSAWIEFDGVSGGANISFNSLTSNGQTMYFNSDEDEELVRENIKQEFAIHLTDYIPVETGDNIVYTPEGLWDKLSAAVDLSAYAKKDDVVEAINELEENKLSKTEAENTYTPIPLWQSGKRYKFGDLVMYCNESLGYQIYKWIVDDSTPDSELEYLIVPPMGGSYWKQLYSGNAYADSVGDCIATGYLKKIYAVPSGSEAYLGLQLNSSGALSIYPATESNITTRAYNAPITPTNLDYAVRSVRPETVICDEIILFSSDSSLEVSMKINRIQIIKGLYNSLEFKLPSGENGDWIQIDFYSGETPPTLTIQSTQGITDIDLIPEANTMYSLFFDFGLISIDDGTPNYGWRFSYAAYPYNTEV